MESDKWPEIVIFRPLESLRKAAHFVIDHIYPLEAETPNTGAAVMLDSYLDEGREG